LHLERLYVDRVRNITEQRFLLGSGANFFVGGNGSGKTSILEAISLLGTGRSFRTSSARPLIQHEQPACTVQGRLTRAGVRHDLGIRRHRGGEVDLRLNGATATSLVDLASALPTVLIDTSASDLIAGAPELRRRYLDATVFHVEHRFVEHWRRYYKVLRQRNAGLRRGMIRGFSAWCEELARVGEALSTMREPVANQLALKFGQTGGALSPALGEAALEFRRGWASDVSLEYALRESLDADRSQGFTRAGPHRADLRISVGGRAAAEVLSRGQLKLAVVALKVAQGGLMRELAGVPPLYLVDDLGSELDGYHAESVCGLLAGIGSQILFTAVAEQELQQFWRGDEGRLFHVEQGRVLVDGN
jgi:DNA replication and repair protein RecF